MDVQTCLEQGIHALQETLPHPTNRVQDAPEIPDLYLWFHPNWSTSFPTKQLVL